ncbi:MAG: hypothetical protein D6690_12115 [Nitrospirae bacterium]|nr:MAG: hypothetical protein D6690_12115 [Nitrospirota bacterium]
MFAGEYLCKLDEKGRFLVPSPVREQLEQEGSRVVFLKGQQDHSVLAYSPEQWHQLLERARTTCDDDEKRFLMHYLISEAATAEMDKAGRILIPGRLRKAVPVDDDQEIILVGMLHRIEIWNPSHWRLYLKKNDDKYEQTMAKLQNLL